MGQAQMDADDDAQSMAHGARGEEQEDQKVSK